MARPGRRATRARRSPTTSTTRWSSRPRPAPARPPSWSTGSCACSRPGARRWCEIVAVTFTEKAAGELKLRLREELERARAKATEPRCATALEEALEDARGSARQHHSRLLRRAAARAAGRSARRSAVRGADRAAGRPRSTAARSAPGCRRRCKTPPEGVRRALRRTQRADVRRRRRAAGRSIACAAPAGAGGVRATSRTRGTGRRSIAAPRSIAWSRRSIASRRSPRRRSSARDNLLIDTDAVRRLSRQIELEQSFGQRDLDGWEARLVDLTRDRGFSRTRKGSGYKFSKDVDAHRGAGRARCAVQRPAAVPQGRRRRPRRLPAAGARRRHRRAIRS